MDTKMDGGHAIALSRTANTNRISTRSTRKRKTTLLNPKKCIDFISSKHSSKNFEAGIAELFKETYLESPTFKAFFNPANADKNAVKTTWLYDSTRVVTPDVDYYHASYVDGYRPNQYVLAQAPFSASTQKDFNKMLQHLKPEAVVIVDGGDDIYSYLVGKKDDKTKQSMEKTSTDDIVITKSKIGPIKDLKYFRWLRWENKCPPESELVDLHEKFRKTVGWNLKGPIVVVCKDGAMKSGVFALLDIEAERLKERGRIKLTETLKHIRFTRSNTFDTQDIFEFACSTIVEMCRRHKK